MSAEFAALSVVDLQPNLSASARVAAWAVFSKTASLAGIFVGSWLVSFASMAIAVGLRARSWASTLAGPGAVSGGRRRFRACRHGHWGFCGHASVKGGKGVQVRHPHGLCYHVRPVRRPLRRAGDGACRRRRPRLPGRVLAQPRQAHLRHVQPPVFFENLGPLSFAPARWSLWRCCSLPPLR